MLAHAVLLSITLGGHSFGLPALKFPWQERRLAATDLQVLLLHNERSAPVAATVQLPAVPGQASSPAVAAASIETRAPKAVVTTASLSPADAPPDTASALPPEPVMMAAKRPDIPLPTAPAAPSVLVPKSVNTTPKPIDPAAQIPAHEQARLEQEKETAEKLRQSEMIAEAQLEATREEQLRLEALRAEQAVRAESAQIDAAREALVLQARERAEATRQEASRRDALRQEQLRQAQLEADQQEQRLRDTLRAQQAAKFETARKEAERQAQAHQEDLRREGAMQDELARQELTRQEIQRAEKSRLEAARQEALRQEQAKQVQLEAARQAQQSEAARQDAIRQEAARQESAKQEAVRQEQQKRELAQREKAKQEEERDERLRAIGRQLNEEAAQREAAKNPSRSFLPTTSGLRRGWLFGRADPNADLVRYAENMSKKFELNMAFDTLREVVKQRHVSPMVTVAVRADGSVEKVTFVVSSGVSAIDEAIRKVVTNYAPYGAFPPALARQYDVIEIRRTWVFDTAIRLQ